MLQEIAESIVMKLHRSSIVHCCTT